MFISKSMTPLFRGFRFSTVNSIANKTYAKFQQAYSQNSQSFEETMKQFEATAEESAPKRTKQRAFQHPYETDVFISPFRLILLSSEAWRALSFGRTLLVPSKSRPITKTFWCRERTLLVSGPPSSSSSQEWTFTTSNGSASPWSIPSWCTHSCSTGGSKGRSRWLSKH